MANITPKFFQILQTFYINSLMNLLTSLSPCPIGTPEEWSKRRIGVVLTPDCGSFRWIRRHFWRKLIGTGNKDVYYKY